MEKPSSEVVAEREVAVEDVAGPKVVAEVVNHSRLSRNVPRVYLGRMALQRLVWKEADGLLPKNHQKSQRRRRKKSSLRRMRTIRARSRIMTVPRQHAFQPLEETEVLLGV